MEATCTAEGSKVYTCVCGDKRTESVPKIDHVYQYSHTVAATCTAEGSKVYTCVCGLKKTERLPKIDHVYQYSYTQAATCAAAGKIVYACVCGKQQVQTLAMLSHNYVCTQTQPATQTATGFHIYVCSGCARSYTETIPMLPPAYMTEYCGSSLLGKALPHTTYYQYMIPAMDRYATCKTREEALAAGMVAMPPLSERDAFIAEYRTVYRYLYYFLPYSVITDENSGTCQFLAWSPEEQNKLLQECYQEVYRILDSLGINGKTSKYDAIYRINDYLCEAKHYQSGFDQDLSSYHNNSTYFSIFAPGANCYNYSIAFQMLCLGAGIECHYYPSKTMNHAWNLVYFDDGTSYWVDLCWNDAQYQFADGRVVETSVANGVPAASVERLRKQYLLITTEKLLKDHTL